MDAMVTILMIVFGVLSGSLLSVLVGLVGSRRRIGFGWAFIISLIFTPLVGLIVTLVSDPLPDGGQRWGCLSILLGLLSVLFLVVFLLLIVTGGAVVASLL